MGQGGAVVLEQLVPEVASPRLVVEQGAAGEHNVPEQLIPVSGHPLLAAHDRHEAEKGVQAAEIDVGPP